MFYLIDYYILQRFQRRTDSGQPTRLTVVVSLADEQVHQEVLVLAVLRVHLGGSPIAPSLLREKNPSELLLVLLVHAEKDTFGFCGVLNRFPATVSSGGS